MKGVQKTIQWMVCSPEREAPLSPARRRACINRVRAELNVSEHRDHVWSYDFVHCRTDDGKAFRTLIIIDEYSRECLAIHVDHKLNSGSVIDVLSDQFILRGIPAFIRSDNGPEFVAQAVQDWITAVRAKTANIEPGSPWENGYCESFNARFRDAFLNGESFYSLREAQILIEEWRKHYNTTTPKDHTVLWATARRRLKPSSRWTQGQSCTNNQNGPLKWG